MRGFLCLTPCTRFCSKVKMRIIHLASLFAEIGPIAKNGNERFVWMLAEYQAAQGHDVSIIATKNSQVPKNVKWLDLGIVPGQLPSLPVDPANANQNNLESYLNSMPQQREFFVPVIKFLQNAKNDFVLHNSSQDNTALFDLNAIGIPIVHTLHQTCNLPWAIAAFKKQKGQTPPHVQYVAVSHASAKLYQDTVGLTPKVIHNGCDENIPFNAVANDRAIWASRISPEKGLHTAIKAVAIRAHQHLDVVGPIYDTEYYQNLKPHLQHPLVSYHGVLPNYELVRLMGAAKAFIFPIQFEESFGLVVVESLFAGTPVIAYPRGGVVEIIQDGVNGFFVNSEEEIAAALTRIKNLDRRKCRDSVLEKFNLKTMVDNYHKIYAELKKSVRAEAASC